MMTESLVTHTLDATAWFSQCRPNPRARLRLFCFPYAGGSATMYRPWLESLPKSVEVYPIELPGRGRRLREAPFNRLQDMVEDLASALQPHLSKPYAFFGHSMGAIISFELARLLRRDCGSSPLHIFVSGRRAPQISLSERVTYNLPEAEFLDDLRRLNGTPSEVLEHPELLQLMLPMLRTDFEVCQTYQYSAGSPLDCPISAFGGISDPDVTREHLQDWSKQTSAAFRLQMFAGDHFFIHSAHPFLLRRLSQDLESIVGQIV